MNDPFSILAYFLHYVVQEFLESFIDGASWAKTVFDNEENLVVVKVQIQILFLFLPLLEH